MSKRKVVQRRFRIDSFFQSIERRFVQEYTFSGETHDFWEIVFVSDGEVEVVEDGNVYRMSEGDIVFHAPWEFHRIKSVKGTPHVFNLSFWSSGTFPERLLDGVFRLDGMEKKEITSLCRNAIVFLGNEKKEKYFGQEIADGLTSFMLRVSREHEAEQKMEDSSKDLAYRRLIGAMSEEVYNNISVADLAEKTFMSVSYVKVLFNRYAGISPKSYYTNLQMSEAARMIAEGMAVKEIAEKMNFSSPNYFSVFFKKHMNMTPKQFKQICMKQK